VGKMKMLDLFSGIGGFALAAQWVWGKELEIVGFVEQDKFCQQVLGKHWVSVPIHSDIRDFSFNRTMVDLITGGFPCQDISIAGKGEGIEGERSGLWSEFKRIISDIRPKFALIENVPAITFRGLDRVLCDLAEIGYDAEWQNISAAEVGAWHKRQRIWIVAYPSSNGLRRGSQSERGEKQVLSERSSTFLDSDKRRCKNGQCLRSDVSGSNRKRENTTNDFTEVKKRSPKIPHSERKGLEIRKGETAETIQRISTGGGEGFDYWQSESGLDGMADGLSYWLHEPEGVPRVAQNIPDRVNRLKALGNAIVPQVAYIIMLQIKNILDNENKI